MIKYILGVSLLCLSLNANTLQIHKRIIPMSLLQIHNIINKDKREINFLIITKSNQISKALELQEIFPKKIKSFSIITTVIEEQNMEEYMLNNGKNIDAVYGFGLSVKQYSIINNLKKKLPTFSYSLAGLKKGALIYIQLQNKIHILLNRTTIKKIKIKFNNQFLQMVEFND